MAIVLRDVKEDSTYLITGVVQDETGAAIASGSIDTFKMWLTDHLGATINSRAGTDISSSVDGSGDFSLVLTPSDNPIVGTANHERHTLVLEWTWDSSADKSHETVFLIVSNDSDIPTA